MKNKILMLCTQIEFMDTKIKLIYLKNGKYILITKFIMKKESFFSLFLTYAIF